MKVMFRIALDIPNTSRGFEPLISCSKGGDDNHHFRSNIFFA
jgi:hypothetical protein